MKSLPPKSKKERKSPTIPPSVRQSDKTFLIAIISIITIIILVGLLFFASRFVGKAIEYGEAPAPQGENQPGVAGIFVSGGEEAINQPFTVPIKANILHKAVGVRFTLNYDAEKLIPDCSGIFSLMDSHFKGNGDLSVIRNAQCDNGEIHFEYAGLCADHGCSNALAGEVTVVEIGFTAAEAGTYKLDFSDFSIINLDNSQQDLIGEGVDATLTVIAPVFQTQQSGSGGHGCVPQWNCDSYWSVCNVTLQQSRVCYDQRLCNRANPTKLEARECQPCSESWVCEAWNNCQNRIQTRNCIDENSCGTAAFKPESQQSCSSGQSQQTTRPLPTTAPPQKEQPSAVAEKTFWQTNKAIIVGSGLGLLVLIIVAILVQHLMKHPKVVYNFDELKNWVRKEKSLGTSKEDIKQILHEHTGWKEEEIESAFMELKETNPMLKKE